MNKKKLKQRLKKIIQFITNPRLLLCFGIAWMITNGWSYILFGLGTYFGINWMITVASSYLAFLWLPISPEKLITIPIAILLLRLLFPKDQKTLAILHEMHLKTKAAFKRTWQKHKDKIAHKKEHK